MRPLAAGGELNPLIPHPVEIALAIFGLVVVIGVVLFLLLRRRK